MFLVSAGTKVLEYLVAIAFLGLAVAHLIFTVRFKRRVAFWFEIGIWFGLALFTIVSSLRPYLYRTGSDAPIILGVSAVLILVTKLAIQPLIKGKSPSLADATQIHQVKELKPEPKEGEQK